MTPREEIFIKKKRPYPPEKKQKGRINPSKGASKVNTCLNKKMAISGHQMP